MNFTWVASAALGSPTPDGVLDQSIGLHLDRVCCVLHRPIHRHAGDGQPQIQRTLGNSPFQRRV